KFYSMENRAESPNPELLQQHIAKQEQQIAELSTKLKWYEEQFRLAQHKRFGASSEKSHPDQLELNLFNEAELLTGSAPQEPALEKVTYNRKKKSGDREAKLDQFPVETIHYTLPESEQVCAC